MVVEPTQDMRNFDAEGLWQSKLEMLNAITKVVQRLSWKDFDALVYKIFCANNRDVWAKYNIEGETYNLAFYPHMSDRCEYAKVTCAGTQQDLNEFAEFFLREPRKLFYVYQSSNEELSHSSLLVQIIGPQNLAEKVIQSGLIFWMSRNLGRPSENVSDGALRDVS